MRKDLMKEAELARGITFPVGAEELGLSSGWVTANKGLDPNNLTNPIDKLAGTILLDPKATFRFDGSDQMPAAVGSDAFWKQSTSWITGQDTATTLNNIEKAWPK